MNTTVHRNAWGKMVKPKKKVQAKPSEAINFASLDHHNLTREAGHLYRNAAWIMGFYAVLGTVYLIGSKFSYSLPFLLISGSGCACLAFWSRYGQIGLPAFPVLAGELSLLNSLSLLAEDNSLDDLDPLIIWLSAFSIALFFAVLTFGWWLGIRMIRNRPSQWNILPTSGISAVLFGLLAGIPLLLLGIVFQIVYLSGYLYQLLPGDSMTYIPVLEAYSGAATSLGAFLGGMSVSIHPFRPLSIVYWIIFILNFLLFASGFLLFTVMGIVFSCAIGMGFGMRRIPWVFLIISSLVLGFLNQGKFVMRNEYWDPDTSSPTYSLSEMPQIYVEWADASLTMFKNNLAGNAPVALDDDEAGESFANRVGNFQNLAFIVNVLQEGSIEPLYGQTYTLIPDLLIPRFLWHEKPRTHAGQIMLNLHFGRQESEEATETTYIAWGLLPEAVGNFGPWIGACFLGIIAGFSCGLLEAWSARKRIFSIEGLVAIALLVEIAGSYEFVASVLIPSIFQLLIAVVTFGFILRLCFWKSPQPVPVRHSLSAGKAVLKNRP